MTWNLPNILTVSRFVIAPFIALCFVFFSSPTAEIVALLLFVVGSLTDWFDGRIARARGQETRIGAMLDPIGDKLTVIIALFAIVSSTGPLWMIVIPAVVILFREVFVSGLREYLGSVAGLLKVTNLAKWKTAAQMTAISLIFGRGIFEYAVMKATGGTVLGDATLDMPVGEGLAAPAPWIEFGWAFCWYGGIVLLWIAAALTAITGFDYFSKALPYLRDDADD